MMPFIVLTETKHGLRPYTRPTSTPGGNGRRQTAQIQSSAACGGLRRGRKRRLEGPREHSRAPEGERRQSKMLCTKFFKTSDT
jgi:hypothetical protein